MGYIVNTGSIKGNKEFTPEAKDKIISIIGTTTWSLDELIFDEYYDRYFDETLKELIKELKPLGYLLNGYVTCYGDYDGAIEVKDNKVTKLTADEVAIKNAADEDLIRELKSRGYKVIEEM